MPLTAISFAEVLNSSDVPSGVINIITGDRDELLFSYGPLIWMSMPLFYCGDHEEQIQQLSELASNNVKRVVIYKKKDWLSEQSQSPYFIEKTLEIKTTWHPTKNLIFYLFYYPRNFYEKSRLFRS